MTGCSGSSGPGRSNWRRGQPDGQDHHHRPGGRDQAVPVHRRRRPLPGRQAAAAALTRQAAEKLAAGEAYEASGYIVCDELGREVNPEWYSDEFRRVRERAGVRRIRLHDERRTINSLMAAAGVPDHIRAAWCGHTAAVNVAAYTAARPEELAAAGTAVSKIIRPM